MFSINFHYQKGQEQDILDESEVCEKFHGRGAIYQYTMPRHLNQ